MTKTISRLGATNEAMAKKYGPLSGLIGTWSGNQGVNLIAVPNQKGSFTLLVAPYYETITVTALSSPTPNRGIKTIEQIPTLMYSLMIHDARDNSLMHAENGIWELLDGSEDNDGYNLARMGSVPHGDALMCLGNSSETNGRPNIDGTLSSKPTGEGLPAVFGYTDVYDPNTYVDGFTTALPNQYLIDHLNKQEAAGQKVIHTTNLLVSTENNGGINNIPSINKNANATKMNAQFWIETVQDTNTGETFQQLQYSQNITIDFPVSGSKKGTTIHWPHINVNTLIKQ